jgi:hypothetical protein
MRSLKIEVVNIISPPLLEAGFQFWFLRIRQDDRDSMSKDVEAAMGCYL